MTHYAPPQTPIKIIHEDHELVVVDKAAGLLSVPGKGPELADCLITRLQQIFPTALLVHRLDRDTSGLMVFALTPHAQRHLGKQFEKRQVKKTYIARVQGIIPADRGQVDLPIVVDWPNRPLQKICHETGRAAVTDWKVLKRKENETLVELMPQTGRSHQLRIHMQKMGHAILGDPFYAAETAHAYKRLMLHALKLKLRHPDGGEHMAFRTKPAF